MFFFQFVPHAYEAAFASCKSTTFTCMKDMRMYHWIQSPQQICVAKKKIVEWTKAVHLFLQLLYLVFQQIQDLWLLKSSKTRSVQ